ncbi:hypothetical protein LINPERPRIM_LOCUS6518 [Linum perenne]
MAKDVLAVQFLL